MSYKILTVDDSRTIRMIVKKAFQEYQCELFEAENGRDGLALANEIKPDLIVLDITMPVMTGIEMLRKLIEIEAIKDTPVIMLTAEGGRDNVMNIVKMGVKDYIVKPFKGPQLIERVKTVLPDLKPRVNLAEGKLEGDDDPLFSVKKDIVILTMPAKITRNRSTELEGLVKKKIGQMTQTGTNKMIVSLGKVEKLGMTAIQSVIALVNLCLKEKLDIRLIANESQVTSLQGFKEASVFPIKLSVEEALADF